MNALKREKQLSSAQLASYQQRENTLQRKLRQLLTDHVYDIGIADVASTIPVDAPISDLISFLTDILKKFTEKLSVHATKFIVSDTVLSSTPSPLTGTPENLLEKHDHDDFAIREEESSKLIFKAVSDSQKVSQGASSMRRTRTRRELPGEVMVSPGAIQERLKKAQQALAAMKESGR